MVPINYFAVLASTVIMIILGGLWYGPLFGKQWIALMGFDPKKVKEMQAKGAKGMWKNYALMALGALVLSYVMAHAVTFGSAYLTITGIPAGLKAGFWCWLGFVVPVSLGTVLWEGKPWKLWVINAGYYLVGMLFIGVILALWV